MAVLNENRSGGAPEADNRELLIHKRIRPFNENDRQGPASLALPLRSTSRRQFLNTGIVSLGGLALWLMNALARRTESIPENAEATVAVPWSAAEGIRFYDRVIVVGGAAGLAVFSSTCPHMGCRINRTERNELVCPCHGSQFNLCGAVVHGPAPRGLRTLPFTFDRAKSILRVTLESNLS